MAGTLVTSRSIHFVFAASVADDSQLGPSADDLLSNKLPILIDWRPQGTKAAKLNKQTRSLPNCDKEEDRSLQVSGDEAIDSFLDNPEDDEIEDDDCPHLDPAFVYSQLLKFRTKVGLPGLISSFAYQYGLARGNEKG